MTALAKHIAAALAAEATVRHAKREQMSVLAWLQGEGRAMI